MKTNVLIVVVCFAAITLATTAFALTVEREVGLSYVQEHPDEFVVSATKGKDDLIHFTITHNVATSMYHVAHLAVYRQGKLVAQSDTPAFGKKRDNRFYFSIARDAVAESRFSLSDSALDATGEVPLPGTVVHQFRLVEFLPKELPKK